LDNCQILLNAWAKNFRISFVEKNLGDCSVILNVWVKKKIEWKGKLGGYSILMSFYEEEN